MKPEPRRDLGAHRHSTPVRMADTWRVGCLALLLVLGACTVQLAPAYDEFIDTSLADLNKSVAAFIAGIPADGYAQTSFDNHQRFYADTLGQIQALKTRAAARPVPEPAVIQWFGLGEEAKNAVGVGDQLPTVESLGIVADRIIKLRERHNGANGLSQTYAERTGEQIQIALRNAITYELALKR